MCIVKLTTLNEYCEETVLTKYYFDTTEEAENFVLEHEQNFVDDPEIHAVYIE